MDFRFWGSYPMKENRRESNEKVDRNKRYTQIIECMNDRPMTFREIAEEMYERGYTPTPELLYSQPRVTELVRKGQIEPVGKTKSKQTGKTVTVFKVIK